MEDDEQVTRVCWRMHLLCEYDCRISKLETLCIKLDQLRIRMCSDLVIASTAGCFVCFYSSDT